MLLARDKILLLTLASYLPIVVGLWHIRSGPDCCFVMIYSRWKWKKRKQKQHNNNMSSNHPYPCSYCNLNNQTPTLIKYLGKKQLVVTPFKTNVLWFSILHTSMYFLTGPILPSMYCGEIEGLIQGPLWLRPWRRGRKMLTLQLEWTIPINLKVLRKLWQIRKKENNDKGVFSFTGTNN